MPEEIKPEPKTTEFGGSVFALNMDLEKLREQLKRAKEQVAQYEKEKRDARNK